MSSSSLTTSSLLDERALTHEAPSRRRRVLLWLLKEPFVHFLLLGVLLFAVAEHFEARSKFALIKITPAQVQGIADNYRLQYGAAPTASELRALVDDFIKEEVFYHEALRLNLDKDDEIIRRRLVQKYEFLQQDLGIAKEPGEADLQAFFQAHAQRYRTPEKVSFSQVFFSADKGGEAAAKARALRTLQNLSVANVTRAPERGDRFPGLSDYASVSYTQVARVFGDNELANEAFKVAPGRWAGPFRSGYGWHVLYVSAHEAASNASYEEVKDTVRRDYLDEQRGRRNAEALERLKQHFTIVREQ